MKSYELNSSKSYKEKMMAKRYRRLNNKYFKYTYYVGVDATDGGTKQGELIASYLNKRYVQSVLEAGKK